MPTPPPLWPRVCRAACAWMCAAALAGCSGETIDPSTQRALGLETINELGLSVELYPGVSLGVNDETSGQAPRTLRMRLSAGTGRLTVRANEEAGEPLVVRLENVHPEAELIPQTVQRLTLGTGLENACPQEEAQLIVSCAETPEDERCQPPPSRRIEGRQTLLEVELEPSPCREVVYELEVPAARRDEPIRFAALGSMSRPQMLERVLARESRAGLDFVVTLGDALAGSSAEDIAELARIARDRDRVIIALPGPEELGPDRGTSFERAFGPFDFRFALKGAQFVSFYSAEGALAPGGLSNLEAMLEAMELEDLRWRRARAIELPEGQARVLPALTLTHSPPIDPAGPRQAGWQSRLEAARVMSLLAEYSVEVLLTGGLLDNAHEATRPEVWITTTQDTRLNPELATYLFVTLEAPDELGQRAMRIERRQAPDLDP